MRSVAVYRVPFDVLCECERVEENAEAAGSVPTASGLARRSRIPVNHGDTTRPLGAHDLDRGLIGVPICHYVHAGLAETQISQQHRIEERRQSRIAEADFLLRRIKLQSE